MDTNEYRKTKLQAERAAQALTQAEAELAEIRTQRAQGAFHAAMYAIRRSDLQTRAAFGKMYRSTAEERERYLMAEVDGFTGVLAELNAKLSDMAAVAEAARAEDDAAEAAKLRDAEAVRVALAAKRASEQNHLHQTAAKHREDRARQPFSPTTMPG